MTESGFNIAAVERETGLSKDVLRVWERRYGFPTPLRDPHGERIYATDQVDRLRFIKRLMDKGFRPGKLIPLDLDALAALVPKPAEPAVGHARHGADELQQLLAMIKQRDAAAYMQAMQQRLVRHGLLSFVQDTVAPMTEQVGEAWERGYFEVFEEHLFTELTKRLLRQAIAGLQAGHGGPRILLSTVPDEEHVLGLLMAEAVCTLEGAECIPLGTETPLLDIARAAEAHRADVVALSFSRCFAGRQVPAVLSRLRQLLPDHIALWAGGGGMERVPAVPGVISMLTLSAAGDAVRGWQRPA